MLPFDLSSNVVLIAVIAVILIIYAILLVKLKPSKETESPLNRYTERKKKATIEPKRQEKPAKPPETNKIMEEESVGARISTSQDKIPKTPKHVARSENQSSNYNSYCLHHFGYLRKLPKSTPIPDECLGCPQAVECMTTLKVTEKLVKGHVTKS